MKAVAMETVDDSVSQVGDEQVVPLQIFVPELVLQKCFHVQREELIWDIKQQILSSLPKELRESFNYGLYCPPVNGKAGKFLDEERPIADYPLSDAVGYLELRYKRRVYKMMNVEEKQIKQLHTRANLRRMLENVNNGHVEKITKLCSRGLDPNFHCPESGETPLTIATGLKSPSKVIIALVNGGALLDFRTKDGRTSLHRAVERNNLEALKTLLDLGASPNYKDSRGLTPIYYSLLYGSDPQLTELLLHDHAAMGTADPQGWQEVHQACKHGLVQHLEHLLFYGADMNARNASGNTPLHVCAVNDQESCARVLLFRGADKDALNYANQNPYQVAVIAGNLNLADIIKNHRPEDVVPYREPPQYNPRRRASAATMAALSRTHSDPRLELVLAGKPPSPCPSNRSLPPFSSSSTASEASTGSSSTYTQPSGEDSESTTSASVTTEKSVTSDSSGVCTSNSGASCDSGTENSDTPEVITVGTTCVCIADYQTTVPGHLSLVCGDIVEVTMVNDSGYLEGRNRDGLQGLFPISCVQEVKLRGTDATREKRPRVEGRRELNAKKVNTIPRRWRMYGEPRTVILHKGKKGFGFVLRGAKATSPLMERQPSENWPSLQYLDDVDKGGVADLAGLKKGDFLLEINGQDVSQASHEHVVAIIRQSGDLVAMTVITVQPTPQQGSNDRQNQVAYRQCATLPRKLSAKKAPAPPKRDPRTTLSVGRARARSMVAGLAEIEVLDRTLNEYDSEGRSTKSSSVESIPNKQQATPAENNSGPKIASIRSRPSSRRMTAAELEEFFTRQSQENANNYNTISKKSATIARMPRVYGGVAAMKRSKAMRTKASDIAIKLHKDFHSVPDLNTGSSDVETVIENEPTVRRRSHSQEDVRLLNARHCRHSWACPPHAYSKFPGDPSAPYQDSWRSIEDIYQHLNEQNGESGGGRHSQIYAETLPLTKKEKASHPVRSSGPPPSHPPPPPPVGQVVKVDVSKALGEYANINVIKESKSKVMSSFRPGDSAKLYASPESVVNVGYKSDYQRGSMTQPRRTGGGSSSRSHSLPPRISQGQGNRNSTSETENSGDSGVTYSTFKIVHKQKEMAQQLSDSDAVPSEKCNTLRSVKGKLRVSAPSPAFKDRDYESADHNIYPIMGGQEPYIPEPDYDSTDEDDIPTSVDKAGNLGTFKSDSLATSMTSSQIESKPEEESQKPITPKSTASTEVTTVSSPINAVPVSKEETERTAVKVEKSPEKTEIKKEVEAEDKRKEMQVQKSRSLETGPQEKQKTRSRSNSLMEQASVKIENEFTKKSKEAENVTLPSTLKESSEDADHSDTDSLPTATEKTAEEKLVVEVSTGSVKENIYVFEQKTAVNQQLSSSVTSNKRKSDGFRIALTGAAPQSKPPHNVNTINEENTKVYMKTSKSCPKDFIQDEIEKCENSSSGVSSDMETQSENCFATNSEGTSADQGSSPQQPRRSESTAYDQVSLAKRLSAYYLQRRQSAEDMIPSRATLVSTETQALNRKNLVRTPPQHHQLSGPPASNKAADEVPTRKHSTPTKESPIMISSHAEDSKVNKVSVVGDVSHKTPIILGGIPKKTLKIRLDQKVHATRRGEGRGSDSECSNLKKSIDESLQFIRLQVDSLGLAAVNEVDVLSDLVPPPPEFGAAGGPQSKEHHAPPVTAEAIAPPPEFSDECAMKRMHQVLRVPSSASDSSGRSSSPDTRSQLHHHHIPHHHHHVPQQHPHHSQHPQHPQQHSQHSQHPQHLQTQILPQHQHPPHQHQHLHQQQLQAQQAYKEYALRTASKVNGSPQHSPIPFTGGGTLRPSMSRNWDSLSGMYKAGHTPYGTISGRVVHNAEPLVQVLPIERQAGDLARLKSVQKEFRQKPVLEWSGKDVSDWLESLFLHEYKPRFIEAGITGVKLANMDSNDFMGLGVKQMGHRLNMERSLKRYMK